MCACLHMVKWTAEMIAASNKKPLPILSFPCIQLLDVSVRELIMNSELQAAGMEAVAKRLDTAASVSLMDLSLEAEAFGAEIRYSDGEVPTVIGHIISSRKEAEALAVPKVGAGRTGIYLEAATKGQALITDRPVFAGIIGPFSLAGRLLDVSEAMLYCYDDPEMVHIILEKVTDFLIRYIAAYQATGVNGVVIAEPMAGLLTPALNEEFSVAYLQKIVQAVQSEHFAVIYHNCGGGIPHMLREVLRIGALGYHFGNAINMRDVLPFMPSDVLVMGNISPADQFRNGTPHSIREATLGLLRECHGYPNFIISSGCDIPPLSSWQNIDAFFAAVAEFYQSGPNAKPA